MNLKEKETSGEFWWPR